MGIFDIFKVNQYKSEIEMLKDQNAELNQKLNNRNYSVPIANENGLPQTAARTAEKEFKPCLRAVPM